MKKNYQWIPTLALSILLLLLLWASFATIDQISRTNGSVIAMSKTQVIQASNDGVIEQVYVREGKKVHKDELLVLLVQSQADAAHKDSLSKVSALKAAVARLEAEVYEKPLNFPPEVYAYPEYISNQRALFERKKIALNEEISSIREGLRLAQEELTLNQPLVAQGDVGKSEIIRINSKIAEFKGQISKVKNKYFQDAQAELTKAQEELQTKEQELVDRSVTLERTEIRAPMDGIVKDVMLSTNGARVRPGDVIMELVPMGDQLIIEAKLSPSEVSFVHIGLPATVKLDAYDYTIYGMFHGEVTYISPDTLIEKTQQGDKPYFRVHIRITEKELASKNGKKIVIEPGMSANIDIRTGERTVLEYITKPITKTFDNALKER